LGLRTATGTVRFGLQIALGSLSPGLGLAGYGEPPVLVPRVVVVTGQ
jgi:hypothetical protein